MEKIKKIRIKNNVSFIDYQKNSQLKFILKILHENNFKYFHKIKLKKIKTSNSTLNSSKNENISLLNNEICQNKNFFIKFKKNNLAQSFEKKLNNSSINFDFNKNNNQNSFQFLNKILLNNNNNNNKLNYNDKILLPKINIKNCNVHKEKNPFKNSAIRNAFDKKII